MSIKLLPFLMLALCGLLSAEAPMPAPPGLTGWWPAEAEGDSLAAAPAATLTAVTSTEGRVGSAWLFPNTPTTAASQGVIPDSPLMRPAAFTITLWCRFQAFDTSGAWDQGLQYLIFQRGSGLFESYSLCKLRNDSNGLHQFLFTFGPASTDRYGIASNFPSGLQLDTWYFLCASFTSTEARLYVDGSLVASLPTGFDIGYRNAAETWIASSGQSFDGRFAGRMDELCLYQRALSSAEITSLFLASDGIVLPNDTQSIPSPGADSLSWQGHWGRSYRVDSSTDLQAWNLLSTDIAGNGANSLPIASSPAMRRFFRVTRLP